MSNLRVRRLAADYEKLRAYVSHHTRLTIKEASGSPPERYQIEYRIRSVRQHEAELQPIDRHLVEIVLPRDYPRAAPQCRMLTPVFHPNIAPHAICVGDHWSAGEPIASIVARIGEILAYQSYNVKSPLNGEAARWAEQNVGSFPLDKISMVLDDPGKQPSAPAESQTEKAEQAPAPSAVNPNVVISNAAPPSVSAPNAADLLPPVAPAEPQIIVCSGCGSRYQVPPTMAGKQARCKKCQTMINIPAVL